MKQLIKDVLDDMSTGQINLSSSSARKLIATTITAALKTKGSYKEYTEYELDEQQARASWVCSICGKNTFEVDGDYIGSGTNHLGCELESENDKKSYINDNVDETDKDKKVDWFDDKTMSSLTRTSDRRESDRREKNWSQKKHEDKVFNHLNWIDKLAEEVVSDNDTNYIYESPDSGKTVYRRKIGSSERELVKDWKTISGQSKAK